MSRETGKAKNKGQREKKLTVKKQSIKDLEPKKGKDIKGGMFPVTDRKKF